MPSYRNNYLEDFHDKGIVIRHGGLKLSTAGVLNIITKSYLFDVKVCVNDIKIILYLCISVYNRKFLLLFYYLPIYHKSTRRK